MSRFSLLLAVIIVVSSCSANDAATPTAAPVGLPNPAAVHCINAGGSLEIREATDGTRSTYCVFPNSVQCEEWALFRGECEGRQDWITVANALSQADDTAVVTRGVYFLKSGDQPLLCGVLRESFPPQCGGDSINLVGYDLRSVPGIVSEGAITWSDIPLVLAGRISGDTLTAIGR